MKGGFSPPFTISWLLTPLSTQSLVDFLLMRSKRSARLAAPSCCSQIPALCWRDSLGWMSSSGSPRAIRSTENIDRSREP